MSEQSFNQPLEDEISLKDIIDFLSESWKAIVLAGILGVFVSAAYLRVTPKQYQATAQIQIAQVNIGNKTNYLGANIEDPNLLIIRLKFPTAYSTQEIKACGFEDAKFPSEALANSLKISVVNGVGSLIELKANSESKETAIVCAQSLFEFIKASQNAIIKPLIQEAKDSLIMYQDRLNDSRSLISRADKSGAALSATYLANRDEVNFLSEEIFRLKAFIASADLRQTRLISPIYASDIPVAPKKRTIFIAGLFGGLFLGLLLMLGRRWFTAYKAENSKY